MHTRVFCCFFSLLAKKNFTSNKKTRRKSFSSCIIKEGEVQKNRIKEREREKAYVAQSDEKEEIKRPMCDVVDDDDDRREPHCK